MSFLRQRRQKRYMDFIVAKTAKKYKSFRNFPRAKPGMTAFFAKFFCKSRKKDLLFARKSANIVPLLRAQVSPCVRKTCIRP